MWWVWLLAAIGGIVAIIVILLSVPVDLAFRLDIHNFKVTSSARVGWLFNRVSREIRPARRKPRRKKRVKKERKPGDWLRSGRMMWRVLRTPGLMSQTRTLLSDLFRTLTLRDLVVDLRVGLDNPFDTAMLYTFIGPLAAFTRSMVQRDINVQPSFDGPELVGYARTDLRLWPIRVAGAGLKFVFSRPAWRIARMYMARSWKKDAG